MNTAPIDARTEETAPQETVERGSKKGENTLVRKQKTLE